VGGEVTLDYEITPEELKALLDSNSDVVVLDVRESWEIQTASLAGSTNIPMGDIPARFSEELDPEKRIVVVCHHGVRSMNVTAWLRQHGFDDVQSLRGGIDRWSREIDPKVPLY
jgi:rhodanese-related sulfurtransferase